eukprot:765939-Hanusia_phi.AAC.5
MGVGRILRKDCHEKGEETKGNRNVSRGKNSNGVEMFNQAMKYHWKKSRRVQGVDRSKNFPRANKIEIQSELANQTKRQNRQDWQMVASTRKAGHQSFTTSGNIIWGPTLEGRARIDEILLYAKSSSGNIHKLICVKNLFLDNCSLNEQKSRLLCYLCLEQGGRYKRQGGGYRCSRGGRRENRVLEFVGYERDRGRDRRWRAEEEGREGEKRDCYDRVETDTES